MAWFADRNEVAGVETASLPGIYARTLQGPSVLISKEDGRNGRTRGKIRQKKLKRVHI